MPSLRHLSLRALFIAFGFAVRGLTSHHQAASVASPPPGAGLHTGLQAPAGLSKILTSVTSTRSAAWTEPSDADQYTRMCAITSRPWGLGFMRVHSRLGFPGLSVCICTTNPQNLFVPQRFRPAAAPSQRKGAPTAPSGRGSASGWVAELSR